jgi:GT2 family glycosyltransferase/glycosyltransferase involved in cell wall biosynthesis
VYGAATATLACLDSVLAALPRWARLVVVDDGSPDPGLASALDRLAGTGCLVLLRHTTNLGFPAAANTGIRYDPERDVVVLNSDTLVAPGWLGRLREAAYAKPEIGTATPLSNDATILSYPVIGRPNPAPDLAATTALDALTARVNTGRRIEIPTAVGFCVYLKRDCLTNVGAFRPDLFAQGYGEENDFCIRARHLGWRHVAALDVFVGHVGGQSFGEARAHLLARNVAILERLHPGYLDLVEEFGRTDPLASARRRLDMARWREGRRARGSVLLITQAEVGGVARRVAERVAALAADDVRSIVLTPAPAHDSAGCKLADPAMVDLANLRFAVPGELDQLARFLRRDRPLWAELHHLDGHDHALLGLCDRLEIPYDFVVHDYALLCPRVRLVGVAGRYCGEPDLRGCEACVSDLGTRLQESIGVGPLRTRSAVELGAARRVIAPSHDTARRIRRHFPAADVVVAAWEPPPPITRTVVEQPIGGRICVVGAIAADKGYTVLLGCARDAAERGLPIEFVVVGYSDDDERLLATGRVFLTGPYIDAEAVSLIRAQRACFAFLPSVWPETWSYALSEAWAAGLDVAAFDLGAPAERIRATGRGWLLPLGLSPPALNARLLSVLRGLAQ